MSNVAGNRNPPRGDAMRRPVGISGLQAGEDVKKSNKVAHGLAYGAGNVGAPRATYCRL